MEVGHGISVHVLGGLLCAVLAIGVPAWSRSDSGAPVLGLGASNMMCCRDENHGTSILLWIQAYVIDFICLKRNQRCEFTRVFGLAPGSAHPSTEQRRKPGGLDQASHSMVAPFPQGTPASLRAFCHLWWKTRPPALHAV